MLRGCYICLFSLIILGFPLWLPLWFRCMLQLLFLLVSSFRFLYSIILCVVTFFGAVCSSGKFLFQHYLGFHEIAISRFFIGLYFSVLGSLYLSLMYVLFQMFYLALYMKFLLGWDVAFMWVGRDSFMLSSHWLLGVFHRKTYLQLIISSLQMLFVFQLYLVVDFSLTL